MSADGGEAKRIALPGTDQVYPRTTNRILRALLNSKGIPDPDIMEEYTPFAHSDRQGIVARVKRFAGKARRTAIISTINGDAKVPFCREPGNQGIKAEDIPPVAFSVGGEEPAGIDARPPVGHLAAWNDFMPVQSPANTEFGNLWQACIRNPRRGTNDPMQATRVGFRIWARAVTQARSTAADAVRDALHARTMDAPSPSPACCGAAASGNPR
jgi:urea transport system substrate-binding protein